MADSLVGHSPSVSISFCSPLLLNLKTNSRFRTTKSLQMSAIHSNSNPTPPSPSLLVFSGGTAFNGVVEDLKNFTTRVAHVLPVSDDGGSTAEIVRVLGKSFFISSRFRLCCCLYVVLLGGPAVGDIRSRCLRLSDQSSSEALAVRKLLGHRLPLNPQQAKSEW